MASPWFVETIANFSVMTHFEGLQVGVIDSRDVLYFLSVILFSLFTTSVILRAHRASAIRAKDMKKKDSRPFYIPARASSRCFVLLAVNFIAAQAKRASISPPRKPTRSPGTRAILAKLDTPVQIRFYCTKDTKTMPVALATYAQRVEDLPANISRRPRENRNPAA
jgi:hypothetical protein